MSVEVRTSPKKARRPQARSLPLRDAIMAVANTYDRMTVRQLFYQLEARGVIEKTDQAYKRVCDISVQMRLDGTLPYGKIADGHRSRRATPLYGGIGDVLDRVANMYRRNYWTAQPFHIEIWCEKDALTGVIQPVCDEWGVPYVATRGFPSLTLMYESAIAMRNAGKPCHLFYFGDHDASGRAISSNIEADLRSHGANVQVHRMALEPAQIRAYNLSTRLGKRTDSRQAGFAAEYGDAAVELDALPPDILTSLVRNAIRHMIDPHAWEGMQHIEALERQTLQSLSGLPLQGGMSLYFPEQPET